MRDRRFLTWCLQLCAAGFLLVGVPLRAEEDFLDPEVAFKLAARAVDDRTVGTITCGEAGRKPPGGTVIVSVPGPPSGAPNTGACVETGASAPI